MADNITFFRTQFEAIESLDNDTAKAEAYRCIFEYAFNDIELNDISPISKALLIMAKPVFDKAKQISLSRSQSRTNKTKEKQNDVEDNKKKQTITNDNKIEQIKTNDNKTPQDKDKDKDKDKEYLKDILSSDTLDDACLQVSVSEVSKEVVSFLNETTGKNFKHNTKDTLKHIGARLKEGFTVEDFKKVITNQTERWLKTDMEDYLRPTTLFGTKFESYLNNKSAKEKNLPDWYSDTGERKMSEDEQKEFYIKLARLGNFSAKEWCEENKIDYESEENDNHDE